MFHQNQEMGCKKVGATRKEKRVQQHKARIRMLLLVLMSTQNFDHRAHVEPLLRSSQSCKHYMGDLEPFLRNLPDLGCNCKAVVVVQVLGIDESKMSVFPSDPGRRPTTKAAFWGEAPLA